MDNHADCKPTGDTPWGDVQRQLETEIKWGIKLVKLKIKQEQTPKFDDLPEELIEVSDEELIEVLDETVSAQWPEPKPLHEQFKEDVKRRYKEWCIEQDAEEAARELAREAAEAEPTGGRGCHDPIEEIEAEKAAAAEGQAANLAICKEHRDPGVARDDPFAETTDALIALGLESTREAMQPFPITRARSDGALFSNAAQLQRREDGDGDEDRSEVYLTHKYHTKNDRRKLAEGGGGTSGGEAAVPPLGDRARC